MLQKTREDQVKRMMHGGLKNLYSIQSEFSFDEFAIITLEGLMLLEREEYLKSQEGRKDFGNGSYLRNFKSLRTNSLSISIPRSRNGKFKPMLLDLISAQRDQINELSLLLYRKGLSTRDVSDVMEEFFGESISRESVNNLAESFHAIRKSWENRELDAYYKVIFCDALFTNLKRGNNYSKEAVYVIYGVKDDNTRELLLLEVNPTEGSTIWGEYLSKLRDRGVEQIDLIVADGIKGFRDVAKRYFPEVNIQRCAVHLQRNMMNKIRPKDRQEFATDLKMVFNNFDEESSKEKAREKIKRMVTLIRR